MIWNELWNFIKRNIFIIVLAVTLAVAAPLTLIFILPIAFVALIPLFIKIRLQRIQKQMFDKMNQHSANPLNDQQQGEHTSKNEGDVTVVQTEQHSAPRVNDEVGEYVDFKEVKED